ncbi:hypothetical protein EW146_g10107 [Bondarzewia mesenterica]|uniref:GED domain-containing protein n=1 Tax=Bondarzewia mesenterica TaxID=1095465 RepID=A0A4S4L0C8_9AGAM|nr:hypothetical protein EW146_g10107 [Bondarzewia mesenterica]
MSDHDSDQDNAFGISVSESDDTAFIATDSPVGLSDPVVGEHRRRMLDLINRVHNTGAQLELDIPVIALPRESGTCTRCPTECRLSYSQQPWSCTVSLHFLNDEQNPDSGQPRNVPFGDPILFKNAVEERIRRAQRAILNPRTDPQRFLNGPDEDPESRQLSFSSNSVCLSIRGKDVADLSFVDLPGLIATVGLDGQESDISLINNLVTSFISRPSCIILLTVACETDFENQGAHQLAKLHDPTGNRTIGVLTKPDRIPPGEENNWLGFIRGEGGHNLDWYSVKNPNSLAIRGGVTWEQARAQEFEFFSQVQPWSTLDWVCKQKLGTDKLTQRLSAILSSLISARLPGIQEEVDKLLTRIEQNLRSLPAPPSSEPVTEILRMVGGFIRAVEKHTEGTPTADGLLQTLRPGQEQFTSVIRSTAPDFRPLKRQESATQAMPQPNFLDDNGDDIFVSATPPIFIEEVMERSRTAVTRELPNNYPFIVKKEFVLSFVRQWEAPSKKLFDTTGRILTAHVMSIVDDHFGPFAQGGLRQRVVNIIKTHIKSCLEKTVERIDFLLNVEGAPHTQNRRYYSDFRSKFFSYYKGVRQSSSHSDLMTKLQPQPQPPRVDLPARRAILESMPSALDKTLAALNELGIRDVLPISLAKLLPPDPMDEAIEIMADVRAYFQVAYKRFVDNLTMTIDQELVRGLTVGLEALLFNGLRVNGPQGFENCRKLLQEPPAIVKRRSELQKRRERLTLARQELMDVFV